MDGTARTRTSRRPNRRGVLVAAGALAATALLPSTAAGAASPHQVDPASMVPTLNPNFAPWTCWEAGKGITCQGELDQSFSETVGLQCDGHEVYATGREQARMTRWHTAGGLATKTSVHLDYPGDVFTLSSTGDGPTLTISGHWNRHYTYAVPGDTSSRTLTEVGAIWLGRADGGGPLVLHDTGRLTFEPGADFEVVASSGGVHEVFADPTSVDRAICDALT